MENIEASHNWQSQSWGVFRSLIFLFGVPYSQRKRAAPAR